MHLPLNTPQIHHSSLITHHSSFIINQVHYFLNIGSNLGNRKLNISRALRALEARYGYFETSSMVESRPWGFLSPNSFANIAVMVITDKTPADVLADIKEIEAELNPTPHRTPDGRYADRVIDIDIMAADDLTVDTPDLTIPHIHLAERRFFLEPFAELAPLWRHPATGLTCAEMLSRLPAPSEDA